MVKDETLNEIARLLRTAANDGTGKTILITGANSGIGLYAAKALAIANPHNRLILVARSMEKAENAKQEVMDTMDAEETNIIPMACDQASLTSVRNFAFQLRYYLSSAEFRTIDALCLNAAMLHDSNKPEFTEDGLEKTFQTNHLAPFLLVNLMHDLMSLNGRIVVTASGLHYRHSFGNFQGMTDSHTGSAISSFTTVDGGDFEAKPAYSSSKLCNVAFALALNRRLKKRGIVVNCFTPGLIPQTGLFRDQGYLQLMLFSFAMNMSHKSSPIEWGGGALAWMAVSRRAGKHGGEYWKTPTGASLEDCTYGREFCPVPPSDEALNEKNQERLWHLSAELAGIPANLM